jgi:hypothetical protein
MSPRSAPQLIELWCALRLYPSVTGRERTRSQLLAGVCPAILPPPNTEILGRIAPRLVGACAKERTLQIMNIEPRSISSLRPYPGNARTHSKKQIRQIAASIKAFGFNNPVLISDADEIIAGHGRVEAAKLLKEDSVPTLRLSHLSPAQRRAYIIADNAIAEKAGWNKDILSVELQALVDLEFDVELTGFSLAEVEIIIDDAHESAPTSKTEPEDKIPPVSTERAVTQPGDVWHLGRHRLPPYNVPIGGHVCGLGRTQHREFAMASGEMSAEEFTEFLSTTLGHAAASCQDGAIAFVCMDWRHIGELLQAGRTAFSELKNLCVWNKTNGGMGTFYRSKHELVFVFKVGTAPQTNTFGLGDTGRYRTNVWDYAGVNVPKAERAAEFASHPTVKPVALVADAIRDCSKRGQIVLDPFAGSGTTLIAAEKTGRLARVVEFDPTYCDRIIARYEKLTGKAARLGGSDTFELVAEERSANRTITNHDLETA